MPSVIILFLLFCGLVIFASLARGSPEQTLRSTEPNSGGEACGVTKQSREPLRFGVFTFASDDESMSVMREQYTSNDRMHYVMHSIRALPQGLWLYDEFSSHRKMIIIQSLDNITRAIDIGHQYNLSTIVYDIEHWERTPESERADPLLSISKGSSIIHEAGFGYGITPDAEILIDNYERINWTEIDFLGMQLQKFSQNIPEYSSFAEEIATFAKCKNPNMEIFTQLSFRLTDANDMVRVIESVKDFVDGFIIAYDTNTRADSCISGCDPSELSLVLERINELT
ncbi:MAG: hypothetical protein M3115_03195 [Thermoproteota archaeon]|nr:hypothetical protein [Thermoproteota archaeon]